MLNPVYINTEANCPFCIKVIFSNVNDENVVKPPQKPTIKNNLNPGVIISLFEEIPTINPIIKLPKIFTVNVPIGIDKRFQCKFNFETINRAILPINPPNPTNRSCFIRFIFHELKQISQIVN